MPIELLNVGEFRQRDFEGSLSDVVLFGVGKCQALSVYVRPPGEHGVIPLFAAHLAGLDQVQFLAKCESVPGGICKVDEESIKSRALIALRDALEEAKALCDELKITHQSIGVTIAYIDSPFTTLIHPRALGITLGQLTCVTPSTNEDIGRMHVLFAFKLAYAKKAGFPQLFNMRKIAWRSAHDLDDAYCQANLLREWQLGACHHMDPSDWNALSLRPPRYEPRFHASLDLDPENEWTPQMHRQSIENLCGVPMHAENMNKYDIRVNFQLHPMW